MTRLDSIRKNGLIPERRHDAFLLALLLAVGLNVAVFAAQALLPHLAALLQSLGVVPRIERQEEAIPFILVDPSFLEEETVPEDAAATAAISRDARQEETDPAEADEVYRPEGVDEQLMQEQGNPGEIDPGVDSAGLPAIEEIGADANVDAEEPAEEPQEPVEEAADPVAEALEPPEAQETPQEEMPETIPEPEEPELPEVEIEAIEPLPAPEPEPVEAPPPPEPPPEPIPEPPPVEPVAEPLLPQPEVLPVPEVLPEPAPEPVPEPVELPPEPVPQVIEPVAEPVPEADPSEAPAEIIDLAMLPVREDGVFDPAREALRERARPMPPVAAPVPEQFDARGHSQPGLRPEQVYQPPAPVPQAPARPVRPVRPPQRNRDPNAPQPTFRTLGGASRAGGAPPRRVLSGRRVDLFGDQYMAILHDKYPEYMTKLGRMLQESLNRTMILYPTYYATGQARLSFRIAPDGVIAWYETQYPVDGSDDTLRVISERTLLEAGPFDPPPAAMLKEPAFRRMSLTVNIY